MANMLKSHVKEISEKCGITNMALIPCHNCVIIISTKRTKNSKPLIQKKTYKNCKYRIKLVKSTYYSNWNSSKMSSCDNLIDECVNAANLGEGIEKAVLT